MKMNEPRNIRGVVSYRRSFGDLNDVQLKPAKAIGIRPIASREEARNLGDRLEGHIVTGHVDEVTGAIDRRLPAHAIEPVLLLPARLRGQVVSQGSVAINGVSLTVMQADETSFSVGLIPHTQAVTNLDRLQDGDLVNMETDILGKYVARNMKVGLK